MKWLKYWFYLFIGRAPAIISIVALAYVWFIALPYQSSYYYYGSVVTCSDCTVQLGADDKFCAKCGKDVSIIGIISTYKHCDYCDSKSLYKNDDSQFCKECSSELTAAGTSKLSSLGFSTIKDFRHAVMLDNFLRLFNNKIVSTILIMLFGILGSNAVYQMLLRKARRKIINDGIKKQENDRGW